MFKMSLAAAAVAVAAAVPAVPTVPIGNGLKMPILGEGSCCGSYNITSWIAQAVAQPGAQIHIDTSCDYGSQPTIAAAMAASGLPRSAFWITSKLNVESCALNMTQALYDQVLTPLNTTYVDLLLLHHAGRWETDTNPRPPCWNVSMAGGLGSYYTCRLQTVTAYAAMQAAGLIRTWGVSNWNVRDLTQVHDAFGFYPPLNQIEFHPYWHAGEVVSFCNRNGILVEAYAPMGDGARSGMLSDPGLPPIAAAHDASIGQVVLRWALSTGADIVIPRSSNATHQQENLSLWSPQFDLNETEIAAISSLHTYTKVYHTDCQPWC